MRVNDTGVGIARDKLARIFDPGFTTKGAPLGTGLGLSIVYQIVEGHGGDIAVASEPGVGTEFTVRLPVRHVRGDGDDAGSRRSDGTLRPANSFAQSRWAPLPARSRPGFAGSTVLPRREYVRAAVLAAIR